MSLIYKSLKKAEQGQQRKLLAQSLANKPKESIGVVPKTRQLIGRFVFFVLLMTLSLGSVYLLVKQSLNALLEESASPTTSSQSRPVVTKKIVQPKPAPKSQKIHPQKTIPSLETSFRKGSPPLKKVPKPAFPRPLKNDQEYYTKKLKAHFSRQYKRNTQVANLQNQLRQAYLDYDQKRFFILLKKIKKLLGKQNLFVLKWEGVWELRAKHYTRARLLFERALNINPEDKTCQINLIYALIGQNQRALAQKKLEQLKLKYPNDPRIKQLAKLLALRKE